MKLRASPAVVCGVALLLVLSWQFITVQTLYHGNWTGLFCIGESAPLPPELELSSFRWSGAGGYDAQFYRLMSHDPAMSRGYANFIAEPRLRYRRILIPALAWISAGGSDRLIDGAYILIVATALSLGVYAGARLFGSDGSPAFLSLGLLALPGSLTSMDRMLLDGVLASLTLAFWLLLREEKWTALWLVCAAAALTRETGLLLSIGASLHFVVCRRWRGALLFTASALPAIVWFAFVHSRTADPGIAVLIDPVFGLVKRALSPRGDLAVHIADLTSLAGLLAAISIALVWSVKRALPVGLLPPVAGLAVLGLLMGGPTHLVEPYGFARPPAPMLAVLFIEGIRRHSAVAVGAPLMVAVGVSVPILSETARWFR